VDEAFCGTIGDLESKLQDLEAIRLKASNKSKVKPAADNVSGAFSAISDAAPAALKTKVDAVKSAINSLVSAAENYSTSPHPDSAAGGVKNAEKALHNAIAKLRTLKVPVLVVPSTTIETIYADIQLVGTAVGDAGAATALVGPMRADMTAIGAAAQAAAQKAGTKPRVFYDVGYIDTTGQIYGPAKGSFLAEMLDMLGVDVITGDATTYEIPLETLIQRDPQIIILGVNAFYKPTPAIIAKRTGWKALTAVKTGDIRSVTDTEITRPGPRLAIGMRNLALAMYPDLVIPSPVPSVAP